MSQKLESTKTGVEYVEKFRRIKETLFVACGNSVSVNDVLEPLFKRFINPDIVSLLAKAQADVPVDIEFITMRYLELQGISNTPLIEKIKLRYPDQNWNRKWLFRFIKQRGIREKWSNVYNCWSCTPEPICREEGNTWHMALIPVYQVIELRNNDGWYIQFGEKELVTSPDCTFNSCIDIVKDHFYKTLTRAKFSKALVPTLDKEVHLYGNWIRQSEYKGQGLIVRSQDDRTDQIFVLGLPTITKDRIQAKLTHIKRSRTDDTRNNSLHFNIKVEGCDKLIIDSLDWYIARPQDYVQGEVACINCLNIFNGPQDAYMQYVVSRGPLCAICCDHFHYGDALKEDELPIYDGMIL